MARKRIITIALALSAMMGIAAPAAAHTPAGSYGGKGFHWLARYYDYAELWYVSNYCNPAEKAATAAIKASTQDATNQREWKDRWPSGLNLFRWKCVGTVDAKTDIKLKYLNPDPWAAAGGGNYGGWNESTAAPAEYCALWAAPYPCGTHYSYVRINKARFDSVYSDFDRKQLIIHETGHSMGMNHHCGGDSIMSDGRSGCPGVVAYNAHDRLVVRDQIYPNWKYS